MKPSQEWARLWIWPQPARVDVMLMFAAIMLAQDPCRHRVLLMAGTIDPARKRMSAASKTALGIIHVRMARG